VETSLKPCILAVYERADASAAETPSTSVRYSIASPSFGQRYGGRLTDDDNERVAAVWTTGRDITDSVIDHIDVQTAGGETTRFHAEYFFNGYNAFCLLSL